MNDSLYGFWSCVSIVQKLLDFEFCKIVFSKTSKVCWDFLWGTMKSWRKSQQLSSSFTKDRSSKWSNFQNIYLQKDLLGRQHWWRHTPLFLVQQPIKWDHPVRSECPGWTCHWCDWSKVVLDGRWSQTNSSGWSGWDLPYRADVGEFRQAASDRTELQERVGRGFLFCNLE